MEAHFAIVISCVSLLVSTVVLVFGNGIGLRATSSIQRYRKERRESDARFQRYLQVCAEFLDGLPSFISATWDWGPSVPNYGASGHFPDKTPEIQAAMPNAVRAIEAAHFIYHRHSNSQGRAFPAEEEALRQLACATDDFWAAAESFARSRWRFRWRSIMSGLRQIKVAQSELDRHARFCDRKSPPSAPAHSAADL